MVAILGALTGALFVGTSTAWRLASDAPSAFPSFWLAIPLATPFGIVVAVIVRYWARENGGNSDSRTSAKLVAATIIAFALAAAWSDFLLSDDNAPHHNDYIFTGVTSGFIGSTALAIAVAILFWRRTVRFAGWPMIIAGTSIGALWSGPEAFDLRLPLAASWLLYPLWHACVALGIWFGLRKPASPKISPESRA